MQESYKVASATQNTQFKVGQTVWCLLYGKGKVGEISCGESYPVMVQFDNGESDTYTLEGKIIPRGNRTLFHSEPQVIAETEPVFEPKLVGKVVLVKNVEGEEVDYGFTEIETEQYIQVDGCVYNKSKYWFYEFKDQPYTFD